ncbi:MULTISPECIES: UTRA domain-containing protein [Streptomyces]|uniref:UTRA domain-containing protein n=1 Tax=Streptomyces TaxID=1883 RepID=UPI00226D9AAA|nr:MULTISPECIES: UTRA domain-containing protein [unclassified Streptomyces]MCY0923705.1 UTRA domain-containing protein [Streptomyces sp. H27-G5]MCY0947740.1 UTRA domain-containing protein [Streptomyces sp. H34-AA3]MCZ4088494.1 UTRA domain-containing protein [Streptomyces sp. H34-S5]MDJ0466987.1 UTRA domain-containing protein [Streptomyces sp. H27-C3]
MTSGKATLPETILGLRAFVNAQEPGTALPAEAALAELIGSTRTLVNTAIGHLMAEGQLIRQGKKAVVQPIRTILRQVPTRYTAAYREAQGARGAFDAEVREHGMQPRWTTEPGQEPAPESVAKLLDLETGTLVATRAREMYADDVPVQVAITYLPVDVATSAGLTEVESGAGGLISRMGETDSKQTSVTETIQVRVPTEREQQQLKVPGDARVYELTHAARTAQNRCVEVTVHVMPVHLWDLSYTWDLS